MTILRSAALQDGRRLVLNIGLAGLLALFVLAMVLSTGASAQEAPPAPECSVERGLVQEAEDARFTGDFESFGDYVAVPAGTGNRYTQSADAGTVNFCVDLEYSGRFILEAAVGGPDKNSNSFWVEIDGEPAPGIGEAWHFRPNSDLDLQPLSQTLASGVIPNYYKRVNPVILELDAGEHQISFIQREDDSRLDRIELVRIATRIRGLDGAPPLVTPECVSYGAVQEAEAGRIFGYFVTKDGALTSEQVMGRSYPYRTDTWAEYCITVTEPGNYAFEGLTKASTNINDSFAIEIIDSGEEPFVWHLPKGPGFIQSVTPKSWTLEPGDHTVRVYLRESEAALDAFNFSFTGGAGPEPALSGAMFCVATVDLPFANVSWLPNGDDRSEAYEIYSSIDGELQLLETVSSSARVGGVQVDDGAADVRFVIRGVRPESDGSISYSDYVGCAMGGGDLNATVVPVTCTQTFIDETTVAIEWTVASGFAPDRWLLNRVEDTFVEAGNVAGDERRFVISDAPANILVNMQAVIEDASGNDVVSAVWSCFD